MQKTKRSLKIVLAILVLIVASCSNEFDKRNTFGNDLQLLQENATPIVLKNGSKQLIVSAEYQGRVLTSTSKGLEGLSYGWFNRKLLTGGKSKEKISSMGGESRIWFGPDMGPNTIFFDPLYAPEKLEHGTPKDLNTVVFNTLEQTSTSAKFGNKLNIENFKGFKFKIDVTRTISLLDSIGESLGVKLPASIAAVAYDVTTTMKNIGTQDWSKETGLLSVWDLGCYHPTPNTTVIIPTKGAMKEATVYFSELDSTRINIKNNVLFYKADGAYLNKIGVLPAHTLPFFGSYSPELNLLTIVKFTFDGNTSYVNSHPINTENEYRGDVTNVFNDGIIGDVGPFGPFYELETSSEAQELKIGATIKHSQQVYHVEGTKENLDVIVKSIFGISIKEVTNALP